MKKHIKKLEENDVQFEEIDETGPQTRRNVFWAVWKRTRDLSWRNFDIQCVFRLDQKIAIVQKTDGAVLLDFFSPIAAEIFLFGAWDGGIHHEASPLKRFTPRQVEIYLHGVTAGKYLRATRPLLAKAQKEKAWRQ